MEETAATSRHARWPVAVGWPASRLARYVPALVVLTTASSFTLAATLSELSIPYLAWDSRAYWDALNSPDPYAGAAVGVIGSYLYPPPFLQVLGPAGQLPWPVFLFGWMGLLAAATVAMLRRVPRSYRGLWPVLVILAGADLWAGNINLLLAAAIVIGLTRPAAWAVVALTKVTPGVGVLWHAFRGRWREAAVAVAATAAIGAVSVAGAPQLWAEWLAVVVGENPASGYAASVPVPLVVRLPLAVGVLWWAARTERAWAVPLACLMALPVIWFNGLSLLLGSAALLEPRPASVSASAAPGAEPAAAG